jgi:prolyl-tRNA editing enzyme YbaK/EbsC (Cys-tRNA(Pro) deacylase)
MANDLKPSAEKVQQAVRDLGFEFTILEFDESTRTSVDAANAIGCTVGQIAKSVIFKTATSGRPVLVLASGPNRVDTKLLSEALGEPIGKADADFVRQSTGFVIGGVPPVGHLEPVSTFIDEDLFAFDEIWAAAGTPNAVFRLTPQALADMTGGQILAIH